jgi:hypothetical protein
MSDLKVQDKGASGGGAAGATAQQVTAAFDKTFSGAGIPKLPAEKIDPSKLPGEAGRLFARVSKQNYTNVQAAWINGMAGEKVIAIMGTNNNPPSDCGLALFNAKGKQLAFKNVMSNNQWVYNAKGNDEALAAGLPGASHGGGRVGKGGGQQQDDGPSGRI